MSVVKTAANIRKNITLGQKKRLHSSIDPLQMAGFFKKNPHFQPHYRINKFCF